MHVIYLECISWPVLILRSQKRSGTFLWCSLKVFLSQIIKMCSLSTAQFNCLKLLILKRQLLHLTWGIPIQVNSSIKQVKFVITLKIKQKTFLQIILALSFYFEDATNRNNLFQILSHLQHWCLYLETEKFNYVWFIGIPGPSLDISGPLGLLSF